MSRPVHVALLSVIAVLVVTIAIWAGVARAVDFVTGLVLGGLTMAGLASMSGILRHGRGKLWQVVLLGIHLLKYPAILIVLYLLITTLQRDPLALMGGYTIALVGFILYLMTRPLQRAAAG